MSEIRMVNENDVMGEIKNSKAYAEFLSIQLPPKIVREELAWQLLQKDHGHYSPDILNEIFDTVDFDEKHTRWFGSLLATPNRRHMCKADPDFNLITLWIDELLFSNKEVEGALNHCIGQHKIKGAKNGVATLLLYLSNPGNYNVWVPTTWNALISLDRIGDPEKNAWGKNYTRFNQAAISFRNQYGLQPREVDWILFSVWQKQ
jgi:hypothetical protein